MNLYSLCTRSMEDRIPNVCPLDERVPLMHCIEEWRREKDTRQRSHPIVIL